MKLIRSIQMNLAVIATVSLTMSPLAMAAESKNLALIHKKRLESFQLSKRGQTYGEYWAKARGQYEPKVRQKLDQWAFNMRNEKMPEVSYSTFVDRDGNEKLRVHFSKNGKTDTMTILATEEKALAFNNVNISPEEAASVDTMVMKIMAEDEKKGREMINAPSFNERRPASSPPLLTAQEFFKLSASDRVSYMRHLSAIAESTEQVQLNEFKIQDELKGEKSEKGKPGAALKIEKWLHVMLFRNTVFAADDDLEELRTGTTRKEKEENRKKDRNAAFELLKRTAQSYQLILKTPGSSDSIIAEQKEKYETMLTEFKSKYKGDKKEVELIESELNQATVEHYRLSEKIEISKRENQQKAEIQEQTNMTIGQLPGDVPEITQCMSGGFFGRLKKVENKTTRCVQMAEQNNFNIGIGALGTNNIFENKCDPQTQAACHPLLFGVVGNQFRCVAIIENNKRLNNVSELCIRASITQNTDAKNILESLFGDKFNSECLKNKECYNKAEAMYKAWKSKLEEYISAKQKVCSQINSDSYFSNIKDKKRKLNRDRIKQDQIETCELLQKRLDELSQFAFQKFEERKITDCSGVNATNSTQQGDHSVSSDYCKCNEGSQFANSILPFEKAKDYCPMSLVKSQDSRLQNGVTQIACQAVENKPGALEKAFNPFWSKREKYKVAKDQCPYSWSDKHAPLGMITGVGFLVGLGTKATDAIKARQEKKSEASK